MARVTQPGNSTSNASALGFQPQYAWVQDFIHQAGIDPANGSMSSNHSGEGERRESDTAWTEA